MIEPETCAMPAVITVISSERVIRGRNGRIVRGASVCPMKMDAATLRLSAPLAPMILFITTANAFTTIHDAEVVQDREQRRDEDDRGHDLEREHHTEARVLFADLAEHKFRAGIGEAQDLRDYTAEPAEDRLPERYPEHKNRKRELEADAPRHDAPADRPPIARQGDADAEDEDQAEDSRETRAERARGGGRLGERGRSLLSLGRILRRRLDGRAAHGVEHEARQRKHGEHRDERDRKRKDDPAPGHQEVPPISSSSLCTRDTSATFS